MSVPVRLLGENELMDLSNAADRAARDELVRRYYGLAFSLALRWRRSGTREDAEDALQDAFALVFERPLRPDLGSFRAFLLLVLRQRCTNQHRRVYGPPSARRVFVEADDIKSGCATRETPADVYLQHEERRTLQKAIEALSPERARVIGLFMDGATEAQIAEALRVTVYSAGLLVDDARAALARAVRPRVRETIAAPVPVAKPPDAGPTSQGLEHDGRTLTVAAWARESGVAYETLRSRLAHGWDVARALDPNAKIGTSIEYDGRTLTVAQWAREYGLNYCTLRDRLKRGWPMEDALRGRAIDAAAE